MRHRDRLWIVTVLLGLTGCGEDEGQPVADPATARGLAAIERYGCGSCHTIPRVRGADALVGPPLDRVASRAYVAGVMVNTRENIARWILNPPGVDPMTAMPNLHVTDTDARDIATFLSTLR
jgi:cytochrome c